MKSHELAKLLLAAPDLPVATHANNHTYASQSDARTHDGLGPGPLRVGILEYYDVQHVCVGNFSDRNINHPNWFVSDMIHGDAPFTSREIDWHGEPITRPKQ